ncbi:MAG: preprotein translocase subunit SecF [Moorella sp. (in: firmicutes)]|uniref:Protein-export membrane protein SecF n=1 Tax=Neomoorella thermoacetica TaxID=1525 RepID=A0A1J5P7C7_NEOTH|nr:preprotein translocase subunit SecF [Moorella sp. (in: firmicutes)]OIQ61267.1 protein-export membrane protein SecF [Moorella thermoacetica]
MYFDFIGKRKWWYALSLLVIIPGLIAMVLHRPLLNFGIDFTGGNILEVKFQQPVNSAQVREVMDSLNLSQSSIQESGTNEFLIRSKEMDENQIAQVTGALQTKLGKMEVIRNDHVGAVIGRELEIKALEAMALAWVLMIIYITLRFGDFLAGLTAILALVHDVLVVTGFFAFFRWEVDSGFVAALLTIIGYSVHDTIVIYDRVRENLRLRKRETFEEIVNKSINQTLRRSINTVVTVLIPLVALLVLGGESTKGLALAMLIGTISGCYSSIFNASPLWVDLRRLTRERHRRAAISGAAVKAEGKAANGTKARRATSH